MGAHNWLIVFWHDFYTSRKVMVNSTQECVLHDSSERRPGSGRPSLLSADQAPAPAQEQRSALSQLEGRPGNARATSSAARPGRRRGVRGAIVGIVIAGAAALAWLAFGTEQAPADTQLAAAHVPASRTEPAAPRAVDAPAAPAAATPAPLPVPLPGGAATATPSAAAMIQDEHPVRSDPAPPAPKATRDDKQDLASLLNAPAAATASSSVAAAATAAVPSAAGPERPATRRDEAPRKEGTGKKPASDKPAHAGKPHAPTAAAKAKAPAKAPSKASNKHAAPAVDSDVALLAALLAHTKTPESGSAEDIFKRCATNATAAEVQRCRVRVCRSSAKDAAECKSVKLSNVAS